VAFVLDWKLDFERMDHIGLDAQLSHSDIFGKTAKDGL